MGAEHVVEFALVGGQDVKDEVLRGLDGVLAVQREDGLIRLQAAEIHRVVPALLAELQRQGATLAELRTHTATLEDLFVALTGRHLRDA
jgi:ABC-2 type transport system ATP-binding protein